KPGHRFEAKWRRAVDDAGRFLDEWAALALGFHWQPSDIFGRAGLAWFCTGERVRAGRAGQCNHRLGAHIHSTTDKGCMMPRPCQRARLESGLKLDINRLARLGLVKPGAKTGPIGIGWTDGDGEQIAAAIVTADMRGPDEGWLHIKSWRQGGLD